MFASGHYAGSRLVIKMENLDLAGGQSFSVSYSDLLPACLGLIFAVLALVGLFLSWRLNKQPLFSKIHLAALLFLAPLVLIFVFS